MTQTLEIKTATRQIKQEPQIIWEKLPEDFILPDDCEALRSNRPWRPSGKYCSTFISSSTDRSF